MKNLRHILILFIILLISNDIKSQDFGFIPNELICTVINSDAFPVGSDGDSIITTNNNGVNQVFTNYSVKFFDKAFQFAPDDIRNKTYLVKCDNCNIDSLKNSLEGLINSFREVEKIPVMIVAQCTPLQPPPNDLGGGLSHQNLMDFLEGECAWNITTGDPLVKISIVDRLKDVTHIDLDNKIVNYVDLSVTGDATHGTNVSGIAAAETNNGIGVSSIGYDCSLLLYNVGVGSQSISLTKAIDAIYLAVSDNASVINFSFIGGFSASMNTAIQFAISNGVVPVAAAGNDANTTLYYPCGYDGVICVTSVGLDNIHGTTVGNHHSRIDICSPARGYFWLNPGNTYIPASSSGATSSATPIISGICGLIKSANPCLTPAEVRDIIKTTARPVADGASFPGQLGGGTVNAYEAVLMASTFPRIIVIPSGDNITWFVDKEIDCDILIESNASLTVTSSILLAQGNTVTIENGGTLNLENGSIFHLDPNIDLLVNGSLNLESGSKLEIHELSQTIVHTGGVLTVEDGAELNVHPNGGAFVIIENGAELIIRIKQQVKDSYWHILMTFSLQMSQK
ncbi:S8 family serine peptidase [bacterium AH-315-M05]|nr:S8 family serine peptidase [bacterium AH-315-M05]